MTSFDKQKATLPAVANLPWGTHFCHFYESSQDLLDIFIPYLRDGLQNNECCIWITKNQPAPAINQEIKEIIPDWDKYISSGELEILLYSQWYPDKDNFQPRQIIRKWRQKAEQALANGYSGLRVASEESWINSQYREVFTRYEKNLGEYIRDQRMMVLCAYPLAESNASAIFDITQNHQFAIAQRNGMREILETPALKQVKAELKHLNEQLENKVAERTRDLEKANIALKIENEQRRQIEAKYRNLLESAPDAMVITDQNGLIQIINRQTEKLFGYQRGELIGKPLETLMPERFRTTHVHHRSQFFNIPKTRPMGAGLNLFGLHKNGTEFPVDICLSPLKTSDGLVVTAAIRDITNRKNAESALIENYNLLNTILENSSDIIFVKDLQGTYRMINAAGARFFGKPAAEIVGNNDSELKTPENEWFINEFDRQALAPGETRTFEEVISTTDVVRRFLTTKSAFCDAKGIVTGQICIARDITNIKQLEEQFRQSQKMEALGQLAGGIAHDFNNLLTVIIGNTELLSDLLNIDKAHRELLIDIQKSGERAANLTSQLLSFSRKQVHQPVVANPNTLLDELQRMLRSLIGENIKFIIQKDAGLNLVKLDRGQFDQAIINLAINARDAIQDGGVLRIETQNTVLDKAYTRSHPDVTPGRYVRITISDSGHGMDEATLGHIFEPFFTTKAPGMGTGLGLAMVNSFIRDAGGHVEIVSQPGHGTTFRIYLPAAGEPTPAPEIPLDQAVIPHGSETILIVENDSSVRLLIRQILQMCGYTVMDTGGGNEAIRITRQHSANIHLLLTDLVMPGMSGRQIHDRLIKTRPKMRTLFMSGYPKEIGVRYGLPETGAEFLQKPFNISQLAIKVREVLDKQ